MSAALPSFDDGPVPLGQIRYARSMSVSDADHTCMLHTHVYRLTQQGCGRDEARKLLVDALDSVQPWRSGVPTLCNRRCSRQLVRVMRMKNSAAPTPLRAGTAAGQEGACAGPAHQWLPGPARRGAAAQGARRRAVRPARGAPRAPWPPAGPLPAYYGQHPSERVQAVRSSQMFAWRAPAPGCLNLQAWLSPPRVPGSDQPVLPVPCAC